MSRPSGAKVNDPTRPGRSRVVKSSVRSGAPVAADQTPSRVPSEVLYSATTRFPSGVNRAVTRKAHRSSDPDILWGSTPPSSCSHPPSPVAASHTLIRTVPAASLFAPPVVTITTRLPVESNRRLCRRTVNRSAGGGRNS